MVALEIPLLLESGLQGSVDYVVVVSAPEEYQKKRVMERKGMTQEWFQKIKSWQLSDDEKQKKGRLCNFFRRPEANKAPGKRNNRQNNAGLKNNARIDFRH